MEEPKLEQFGLNKEQHNHLIKNKDKARKLVAAISIIIAILFWIILYLILHYHDFTMLVGSLFLSLVCASLIEIILWHLYVGKYSGKYRKLNQYNTAKQKYESWWNRNQESFWLSLSGKKFERELASLYSKLGYEVEFPKRGGADQGIDFLLMEGGKTIIVQCKAHKQPVGPHIARDLYGTLISSLARRAVLASISGFTPGVIEFIQGKPIDLVAMEDIIRMRRQIPSD